MTHIFVSHSSKDDDTVTKIHDALEAAGLDPWVDHEDGIGPGDNWSQQIQDSLNDCEVGLLVLSPDSATSPECEAEYRRILSLNKRLYVILITRISKELFPWRLGTIQYVDATTEFDNAVRKLAAAMLGKRELDLEDGFVKQMRPISGNIDARLTTIPISGRDRDIAEITRHLSTGRPTLILGVGGLGKSRLAAEMVLNYLGVDGAIWHRCSEISRADEVLVLLRQHFGLDPATEREDVLRQFRQRKRLVIFDNAESIPESDERRANYAQLINELAQHDACVLLTSRVEWNEIDEPRYTYRPQRLEPAAAAAVVRDMAATFSVTDAMTDHAAEFAEAALYHAGMMDWSVRQLRRFPLTKVLNDLRALPNREPSRAEEVLEEFIHRTLRQMVEATGPAAEQVLRRLAVCRGGFTYESAHAIGNLPEHEVDVDDALDTLQTWQFIRFDNQRYFLDPLVEAILQPDDSAHHSHYDYFYNLAEQQDNKQDYLGLDIESDNLEVAVEWSIANDDGEAALGLANACGHFLSNRGRFEQRLEWFERIMQLLENHHDNMLRANAQNSLGMIFQEHPFGNKLRNLERAIFVYEEALRFRTPETAPLDYATTQNNLGNAYGNLATVADREDNLHRRIAAYEEALRFRTPETAPLDYATTQNNLGNAYSDLARIEDREDNLRRAIAAYQEALRFRIPKAAPLDYATTQNNLGNAYGDLATIENREGNLRRRITAYQEALRFRTPETAPLDYAATQNNLGNAYGDLATIADREDNIRRRIAAYQEALRFRTPETAPLDYAATQNNLGNAYGNLATIEDWEGNLRRRIAAYQEALRFRTPETAPLAYATTQNNLGNVYGNLATIEDWEGNLRRRIAAYEEALRFRTPETAPLAYAATQNNLGNAYSDLAAIADRKGNLNRAIAAYEGALHYRTASMAPLDFAMTQRNLGIAYRDLNNSATAITCWREAEKYYRQMDHIGEADKMLEWIADVEARLAAGDDADSPDDPATPEDKE